MYRLPYILLCTLFLLPGFAHAEVDPNGNNNHYAQFENSSYGVITFDVPTGTELSVTDSEVVGHAWGDHAGWITFNPTNGGVVMSPAGSGTLSGYAWGENTGWINFAPSTGGVSVNDAGQFSGYAWSENFGWLYFDCGAGNTGTEGACLEVDWPTDSGGSSGGGVGGDDGDDDDSDCPPGYICTPTDDDPDDGDDDPVDGGDDTSDGDDDPVDDDPVDDPVDDPIDDPVDDDPTDDEPDETDDDDQEDEIEGGDDTPEELDEIDADILSTIGDIRSNLRDWLENSTIDVVSKIATALGVGAGLVATLGSSLFLNPISFSEIVLIPLRLWSLLLSVLGLKRQRPWGTVYDSVTKQPLDPAYVVLKDMDGNEVDTSITDIDGRYALLVAPGTYVLEAHKTHYTFPSKRLRGKERDELYTDLYFGAPLTIDRKDQVIRENIPMDPQDFDWNEFAKRKQKLTKFYRKSDLWLARITNAFFYLGFAISAVVLFISPVLYNIIIFVLYVILFVIRRVGVRGRSHGRITTSTSGEPLPFAVVRIYNAASDREVKRVVANAYGKYFALVHNDTYYLTIEERTGEESYRQVYRSHPFAVTNGIVNKHFEV